MSLVGLAEIWDIILCFSVDTGCEGGAGGGGGLRGPAHRRSLGVYI